jgi:HTH-type transcriptional regulator/antitoxin HigA
MLIVEPHLPHTHLDGAAVLLDGKLPVIGLTLRHDRLDNFWFVLLHETAHILLHRKRGLDAGFFDNEIDEVLEPNADEREREADRFAQAALIPDEAWNTSLVRFARSASEIRSFAEKFEVGVAVVAGRIRRERGNYQVFSNLVGHKEVSRLFQEDAAV